MYKYEGYTRVTDEQFGRLIDRSKSIVLFGTMGMGLYAKRALDYLNINPVCFCDNSKIKQNEGFEGLDVLSPEKLSESYIDADIYICSFNIENIQQIKKQLSELGFENIFGFEVLYSIYLTKVSKRFMMPQDINQILNVFYEANKKFIIRRALISITTKCNLRCRDCASLMPYFEEPINFDKADIVKSVRKLTESVDGVEELFLFGGEPLLHPDLAEICNELSKIKNVLRIYVITNGRTVPDGKLIEVLKRNDIDFVVSDYDALSRSINDIIRLAKNHKFNLTIKDKDFMWSKVGKVIHYDFTEEELTSKFENCVNNPFTCFNVINGKFHVCSHSAFGTELKAIPSTKFDFVDLLDDNLTLQMTRDRLEMLVNHTCTITACTYCKFGEYVKPAIQI